MNKIILAGLVVGALGAQSAMAGLVKITDLPPTGNNGGPFQAQLRNDANTANVGSPFATFCLEKTEYLAYGLTFNYALNNGAVAGGLEVPADSTPGLDEISWGTAWLYDSFRNSASFATTDAQVVALQNAFCYLEDEIASGDFADKTYYTLAANAAVAASIANVAQDAAGAFGVKVMNLTVYGTDGLEGYHPTRRQDLLYVPDGGTTLVLLGLGLSGLAFASRRVSK